MFSDPTELMWGRSCVTQVPEKEMKGDLHAEMSHAQLTFLSGSFEGTWAAMAYGGEECVCCCEHLQALELSTTCCGVEWTFSVIIEI